MNDVGKEFVKKIFGEMFHTPEDSDNTIIKTNIKSKVSYSEDKLQQQINNEEAIITNKIKLKAIKSITDSMLDKAFNEANLDEYIKSIIQLKVTEKIKYKAYYIVDEALEDIENNFEIKRTIRTSIIEKIKSAFK